MNDQSFLLAESLISSAYVRQAQQNLKKRQSLINSLLAQKRLPQDGWDDETIEMFLQNLAAMDSNNFLGNAGVGEREGRIFSNIVRRRHFGLGHGVGRSGDLAAEQPKAAGSSLLAKLTQRIVVDAAKIAGLTETTHCIVLPFATGMSISISLLSIKKNRPNSNKVLWFRIDQKTCLKAIDTAGLTPIVIENVLEGDELRTNLGELERLLKEMNCEDITAVITTTSCFAPRGPDRVVEVAKLCSIYNVPHIINHAYGLQADGICKLICRASRVGRVDGVISSTDKNFLVPVGGAVLFALRNEHSLVDSVSRLYPGRASNAPVTDLFITLLSMGVSGYTKLLEERKQLMADMQKALDRVARAHDERMLATPSNEISMGMTLSNVNAAALMAIAHENESEHGEDGNQAKRDLNLGPTFFGSMLFSRCCSGTRSVSTTAVQTVAGIKFQGYGSHTNEYPVPYLTAACAIGITREDIDHFVSRLDQALREHEKKVKKRVAAASSTHSTVIEDSEPSSIVNNDNK